MMGKRLTEYFGHHLDLGSVGTDQALPWGRRLIIVTPTAEIAATLPDARGFPGATAHVIRRTGGPHWVLWNQSGTWSVTVKDNAGGTVGTIAPQTAREIYLIDRSSQAGTWWLGPAMSSIDVGTALNNNRQSWAISLWSSSEDGYELRQDLLDRGWNGTTPVAATVEVLAGVVLGGPTTAVHGFDTGPLPAGSTVLLVNNGLISGRGGDGGDGGGGGAFGDPPTAGGDGGVGIRARVDMAIDNQGTVQGGGGGGGGGDGGALAGDFGGGGGGGAGFGLSDGGTTTPPAVNGSGGGVGAGGPGGPGTANTTAGAGGNGGAPGSAGSSGGGSSPGAGGAAGPYLRRETAVTVTWINNGTRLGAEEVV